MNSKVYGMVGLAIKARKVSYGTELVKKAIRNNKAQLILLSTSASMRCKKDINDICTHYKVDMLTGDFSQMFSQLTKKELLKVMSINDEGFAQQIRSLTSDIK